MFYVKTLCYIVPLDSSREALIETSVLDRISDFIIQISNETTCNDCYYLLICGDLNSRTGTDPNYVIYDNKVLPDDYEIDTSLNRFSQDHIVNAKGRTLLEFCKLNICNGRLGADNGVGKCTSVGSSGSSLVDCVLVSKPLMYCVYKIYVDEPNILSDHCALFFISK